MKTPAIIVAALGTALGLAAIAPAEAMPNAAPNVEQSTDVQQAKVVVKLGYWNGHRGYRYRRPGYRLHNGFWYPPAAFKFVVKPHRHRHWYWCGPKHHRHRCWR
jgi:hypothetical protein